MMISNYVHHEMNQRQLPRPENEQELISSNWVSRHTQKLEIKIDARSPNINIIKVNPTTRFKPQKQGILF